MDSKPSVNHSNPAIFSHVKSDFLSSIVVFLVALPLCMGIAIASGAPVAAGLITGIVGGLVVGMLAGSPLQVSGPAAGLTVIVYDVVQRFGIEALGIVVLIAGAFQLLAGLLYLGQWFRAVSPAVIKGMLAGIGVLIFASQFHVMVDDQPKGSGLKNLITIPEAIAKGLSVPEMGTRAERQFKTEKLRHIGEVHRQQVWVHDRIAQLVPHHRADEPPSPEKMPADLEEWDALVSQQQQVVKELETAIARLEAFPLPAESKLNGEKTREAAAVAMRHARAALADLEQERYQQVHESQARAADSVQHLLAQLKNHNLAAEIGLFTIVVIVLWQGLAPKKWRLIPAPLVAVVLASGLAASLALPVLYVEVPGNLLNDLYFPSLLVLQEIPWMSLAQAGLFIAVIASAETLLCATAVDQMHQGPRTKYDRELAAQGVGNMICGVFGALPMTGVIVRSGANVQAGARTRLSAILHGLWLLIFVVVLAALLRMIPTSALAAMLVYTGYKLVDIKAIKELRKFGWGEVGIYAATVLVIVVEDLLAGVLVGIALSGLKLLYTFSHLRTSLKTSEDRRAVLSLQGAATFIRLPKLARELERVPADAELHVEFERLTYIDHACLDLLTNWARQHQATGGRLVLDWDSLHAKFRAAPESQEEAGEKRPSNGAAAKKEKQEAAVV